MIQTDKKDQLTICRCVKRETSFPRNFMFPKQTKYYIEVGHLYKTSCLTGR